MPIKQPITRTYRSANGKAVDLDKLIARNELTPAVGNVPVNARGDQLGPGGKIVRKREDLLRDYYNQGAKMPNEDVVRAPAVQADPVPEQEAWDEDDQGNFVKVTAPKPTRNSRKSTGE